MFESKINRGKANGYAPLDGSGKVPLDKLPPIQSTIDTGSFATTDSNIFTGDQTISTIQGTGSLYLKPDFEDSRHFEIYITSPSDTHIKSNGGLSFFGDDTNYLKIDDDNGDIEIRANDDITLYTNNGSIILNPDYGVYINSVDVDNAVVNVGYLNSALDNTTGSLVTKTSFNQYTASVATTGSNFFRGNQSISGSVNISSSLVVSSTFINSGSIEALNSDLIIDGGDIILSGSFIQQVNYAPMASGSWEFIPNEEVTQLDITKDIHLLDTTGAGVDANFHWYLPDGLYDGQVVRFALNGDSDTNPNYVNIWMANLRTSNGTIQSNTNWYPFWNNENGSARSLATAVFIDGAWNIDNNYWDM
jgi:hypothetical protein